MTKKEFFIPSSDGETRLHGFVWEAEGTPKAVFQLVHGMVEYIDRYSDFATFLAERGITVIGHDHLGHGQSVTGEEKLGYFAKERGYELLNEDIHKITEEGKKRFPGVPFFILGHSMGSFLVRRYLTTYGNELSGAVIMGTGFIPAALAGTGKVMAKLVRSVKGEFYRSQFLTNLALGSYNKPFAPNRTEVDWLSRNDENVDKYVADPLCGYQFTASAFVDFFTVIEKLAKKENFGKMPKDLPVLITSGELDPVGGKAAVEKLTEQFRALPMTKVTVKLYPEDRHEILNEVDRETVYQDIYTWITENL